MSKVNWQLSSLRYHRYDFELQEEYLEIMNSGLRYRFVTFVRCVSMSVSGRQFCPFVELEVRFRSDTIEMAFVVHVTFL